MTEFDLRQYGIQVSKPVCKPKEDDSYEEKKVFPFEYSVIQPYSLDKNENLSYFVTAW